MVAMSTRSIDGGTRKFKTYPPPYANLYSLYTHNINNILEYATSSAGETSIKFDYFNCPSNFKNIVSK